MLLLGMIAVSMPAYYAGADSPEMDDGIDVYFRNTDLLSIGNSEAPPSYSMADPGESKRIERAFETSPPSIPHAIEDMYPIRVGDNECLECHSPDNAGEDDLPLPDSHFLHPNVQAGTGAMRTVVTGYRQTADLNSARYNCSMCHTPQATNVSTPNSKFMRMKAAKKLE